MSWAEQMICGKRPDLTLANVFVVAKVDSQDGK